MTDKEYFFTLYDRAQLLVVVANAVKEPEEKLNELSLDRYFYFALWRD